MPHRNVFARLIDDRDRSADSLVVGAAFALAAACIFQGYDTIILHHDFSPLGFGGGCAAILGGTGAGKGFRSFGSRPIGYGVPVPDDPDA